MGWLTQPSVYSMTLPCNMWTPGTTIVTVEPSLFQSQGSVYLATYILS